MKAIIPVHLAAAAVFMFLFSFSYAQDSTRYKGTVYTFIINKVPDHFPAPLVGFVNVAKGSQNGAQIGFVNQNQKNINGTQIGFVNNTGGYFNGAQIGFSNLVKDSVNGGQIGFVNISGKYVRGVQTGFVNLCNDSIVGAQVGFLNIPAGKIKGAQVGFVNLCKDSLTGTQVGFVNVVKDSMAGAQIGFVNTAGKGLKGAQIGFVNSTNYSIVGSQIGFVNIADSISDGVPLGFVSIVRKGGFSAFEIGTSTLFPSTVAYKIGVPKLYTSIMFSFNPAYTNQFAYGAGLGTIIRLNKTFGFNPEATIQSSIEQHPQMFTSLTACFSLHITPKISLVAGPSVTWIHKGSVSGESLYKPGYSLYDDSYDYRNRLTAGAQASLRFHLN